MQNGILKRAILDFRWFYALKDTPNRPFGSTHKRIRMALIRLWLNRFSGLTTQSDYQIHMAVGTFKTMQNGILKRAILDFRRFYALKATRPVGSC